MMLCSFTSDFCSWIKKSIKQMCLRWDTLDAWVAKLKWNRLVDSSHVMGIEIGTAQLFGKKRKADLQQLVKVAALSTL